ncbi:hypothetical protein DSL72_004847 [Monilinia vaccinii-corymbosi]|uniref:Uncharacterized protein n=1 Tax=Monilinia vaccinii-corymbosi TaxID=61207 RepID=A0A8A3NXD0_9HELO|nr:hypothetical protein DSL72_004847 [Monilinia vaccinii-corymbosi]
MLSRAACGLQLSLLFATATATSIPIGVKDSSIAPPFTISTLSSNDTTLFCDQIAFSSNFSSHAKNYSPDSTTVITTGTIISLDVNVPSAPIVYPGNNSAANCEKKVPPPVHAYGRLLSGCGNRRSTPAGSGPIDASCGIDAVRLARTKTHNAYAANAAGASSKSGVSYCMVTGSVLLGVAALFGWFL